MHQYPIRYVSLLGSFGRGDADPESDMDPWVVCDEGLTLQQMAAISDIEKEIRQVIAREYDLPNLARHRASVFLEQEAELYRCTFHARVEVPRLQGEQNVIMQHAQPMQNVQLSQREAELDQAVSLDEFTEQLLAAIQIGVRARKNQEKWSRRIAQQLLWFAEGTWISSKDELDRHIALFFAGQPERILRAAQEYGERVRDRWTEAERCRRILTHKIMWNLEKVRWELFQSLTDVEHFHLWRLGQKRFFGFPPQDIGLLAEKIRQCIGQDDGIDALQRAIQMLTADDCAVAEVHNFYEVWQHWLQINARSLLQKS